MKIRNSIKLEFESRSVNEAFARMVISAFLSQIDPTVEELSDIKTAVSEVVTNCVVHAYKDTLGKIYMKADILHDNTFIVRIRDKGCGMQDVSKAMQPLYTTGTSDERAGLGFSVMESMVDKVKVNSTYGKGTTVVLRKKFALKEWSDV